MSAGRVDLSGPAPGPPVTPARKLDRAGSHVVRGSFWLFAVLGVQSVAGVLFLFLAAHRTDDDTVGLATALFTGLQYVNYASGLGIDVALARFAPRRDHQSDRLFGWGAVCSACASVVGTIAYLSVVSTHATGLLASPAGWLFFFTLAAGTSVYNLVDVRLMAARRWRWMLGKVSIICTLRLGLVFVNIHSHEALWLFALLAAPTAVAGLLGMLLLPAAEAGHVSVVRPDHAAPVARFAAVNWIAALAFGAPQFTLPVIVSKFVSDARFANFYLAWSFTAPVFFIPAAIHQVLLVEGARDDDVERGRRRSVEAMVLAAGMASIAFVGSLLLAGLIPRIYGNDYREAVHLLPLLMAGTVPWAVSTIRLAEARLRKDHVTTVAITLTFGLGILGLAIALVPSQGIDGAVRAWLIGNAAAAAISVVLGLIRRPR